LFPLLVAMLAIALDDNHERMKYLALGGTLVSLLFLPFVESGAVSFTWFSINSAAITITTSVTPLNYLLIALILVIAPLVFMYSFGFMELPSEQQRYYIEMLAFESAMLAFAMSGDFILLFIAWEFLSLTSYLLIGFWQSRERAIVAARKAITIVLIGDLSLLAAIIMIQNSFGTLVFSSIISELGNISFPVIAAALLVVAIATKSAQFPFHEWLPDAMEGPTPVSAFLHSTTMVKAGVFVAIILLPLLSAAKMLGLLLAVGAATVAIGILNALRERRVKRVLAYSTIQELGLMLVALAANAPLLAVVYFFFAQSFYKALLFFSSGVAMKANESEDIEQIAGIRQNRIVYVTTLFGVLALAGFVPFDGFFANVGFGSSFSANMAAYLLLSLSSLGISLYIFRWFFMLDKKSSKARIKLTYSSTPKSIIYSMLLLAAATLIASVFFFTLPGFLAGPACTTQCGGISISTFDAVAESFVVALGAFVGYLVYAQKKKSTVKSAQEERVLDFVYTAEMINASYAHLVEFVVALADGMEYLDSELNNLFDWFGHLTVRLSGFSRRLASGSINSYVGIFTLGVLVLIVAVLVI
jgi:NADH-quinone oxidoreductase subunit L